MSGFIKHYLHRWFGENKVIYAEVADKFPCGHKGLQIIWYNDLDLCTDDDVAECQKCGATLTRYDVRRLLD